MACFGGVGTFVHETLFFSTNIYSALPLLLKPGSSHLILSLFSPQLSMLCFKLWGTKDKGLFSGSVSSAQNKARPKHHGCVPALCTDAHLAGARETCVQGMKGRYLIIPWDGGTFVFMFEHRCV